MDFIQLTKQYSANNYNPLPLTISSGSGVWVWDTKGTKYLDMLSSYSALNQGHRHPKIIEALKNQAEKITLLSRAFYSDVLALWCEKICKITKKDMVLPMNTGAEAVESALKAARRYGYQKRKIPSDKAQIIVCENNFHGRTLGALSLSSDADYRRDFGPFLDGIKVIKYGDIDALKSAINENTAAFLVEPIQGEAGIIIPPKGYLKEAFNICKEKGVLFIADEIQTGLGRTGDLFACDFEGVVPDMYVLGKALGGGVMPISAIVANKDILDVFNPGSHGSTFGGNPLACAVSIAALDVLFDEHLVQKSKELGDYFLSKLKQINHPNIKKVRGRGLFIGLELHVKARSYCEKLQEEGLLCKETHDYVVRFAPPLVITKSEIDLAFEKICKIFEKSN
ncbi:MAG: ornithine--oxo-acid transaminase [Helicobacter sp.]|nr:ornithine--oxo-acid transaminase [Helicobacter sp.]